MRLNKMKNYLFFLGIIWILLSGCDSKATYNVAEEIEKISKAENCELGFVDDFGPKGKKITIQCKCTPKDDFFLGKLLLSTYWAFERAKIKRDVFKVKTPQGQDFYGLKTKDLRHYSKLEERFQKNFEILKACKRETFETFLDSEALKQLSNSPWYEPMFERFKQKNENWVFNGFGIQNRDGEEYIFFANTIPNEVIIYMSYKLSANGEYVGDDKIYGMGVIPL